MIVFALLAFAGCTTDDDPDVTDPGITDPGDGGDTGETTDPGEETDQNIEFTYYERSDGSYMVTGFFDDYDGSAKIVIPSEHNGKPVTRISSNAFSGCSGLTDVYYTGDLAGWLNIEFANSYANPTSYADNLYIDGELLEGGIVISDGVTKINAGTFYNCRDLTSITIPDSVTSIGSGAFSGCTSLRYNEYNNGLYLGNTENPYVVFIKTKSDNVTNVMIHSGTKVIYSGAFARCNGLTSVTIPDSVTSIGSQAFWECSDLTSTTFQGTMQQWKDISKGVDWNYAIGSYTVTCTDGVLDKNGQQIS